MRRSHAVLLSLLPLVVAFYGCGSPDDVELRSPTTSQAVVTTAVMNITQAPGSGTPPQWAIVGNVSGQYTTGAIIRHTGLPANGVSGTVFTSPNLHFKTYVGQNLYNAYITCRQNAGCNSAGTCTGRLRGNFTYETTTSAISGFSCTGTP